MQALQTYGCVYCGHVHGLKWALLARNRQSGSSERDEQSRESRAGRAEQDTRKLRAGHALALQGQGFQPNRARPRVRGTSQPVLTSHLHFPIPLSHRPSPLLTRCHQPPLHPPPLLVPPCYCPDPAARTAGRPRSATSEPVEGAAAELGWSSVLRWHERRAEARLPSSQLAAGCPRHPPEPRTPMCAGTAPLDLRPRP